MAHIKLEIKNCKECPFLHESPYPTMDSFERPSYWWCGNPKCGDVACENEQDEKRRLSIISNGKLLGLRKIAGYVEWNDEKHIKIPNWCPAEC